MRTQKPSRPPLELDDYSVNFENDSDETAAMKVWQCLPAMSTR